MAVVVSEECLGVLFAGYQTQQLSRKEEKAGREEEVR